MKQEWLLKKNCSMAALLHYARHAGDYETVAFSEGGVVVERVEAGKLERIRLEACWKRIAMPDSRRGLIALA
ncbi:DUF2244 domain-containing protein [Massilia sp. CCM 8734]|uniref:DUF2244 domain-containing protein n=1 Tax=Massilia sp. CCM 8734 TaxID=2609283 RepID=UPI001420ED5E|nr:DUF2244 domain-containing protein [Massilia sp. CCM 8734]NIA00786.1 DUF2244 domain-containing protein [Massilia sp. CCM 8734]